MTKNLDLDFLHEIPEQGSEAWLKERLGRFTGSRIGDLLTNSNTKGRVLGKTAYRYISEVAIERITGLDFGFEGNEYTEWGNEHESEAIAYYEQVTGFKTHEAPFIALGTNSGGSPDRFVDPDGIAEVKCPSNPVNHMKYFLGEEVSKGYYAQMQNNLMVTGKAWCDFISYDPRLPESHRIFIKRFERDEELIKKLRERIDLAEIEVLKIIENGRS